ncbi:hypothetical protein ER308_16845 [Egibacter rhizosphaerae]|uniref:Uncharacterized protein n=1 Tax=Egibacter rhizosphaerae TaxID=1670831 RepID=A0A411YJ25_9ACTN|nr:hypothetical protein [Egibacter rhizosphaerae]QBI21076.1 hypothetical protein ER308_16845 [Egibacter rhizosphaerae]
MTAPAQPSRSRLVARHLLVKDLGSLTLLWLAYLATIATIAGVIAVSAQPASDVWGQSLGVVRAFMLAFGVYLTAMYVPAYIAHGLTRREVAAGTFAAGVGLVAFMAALIVAGHAVETAALWLLGRTDLIADPHPLGTVARATDTFVVEGSVLLLFLAVGGLAGAAFYRHRLLGVLSVPVGIGLLSATSLARTGMPALLPSSWAEGLAATPSHVFSAAVSAVAAGVAALLCWWILRDMPLRNRRS